MTSPLAEKSCIFQEENISLINENIVRAPNRHPCVSLVDFPVFTTNYFRRKKVVVLDMGFSRVVLPLVVGVDQLVGSGNVDARGVCGCVSFT